MPSLLASLLSTLVLAGAGVAEAAAVQAAWVNPGGGRVVLRAQPRSDAPARAYAFRGERLRVMATARTATGVWQRVGADGRLGWLAASDARAVAAPKRWSRGCFSRALGSPGNGRLSCGHQLPSQGTGFRTWDFPLSRSPNRLARRWGTSRLVERVTWIARRWHDRHPLQARLLVGDLSRPRGGPFTARFGGIGHATHQNGLDVDIYYPRADGAEREASRPSLVDRRGARELVALIARSRPQVMFVGCDIGLVARGRARHLCTAHENHVHVRYAP